MNAVPPATRPDPLVGHENVAEIREGVLADSRCRACAAVGSLRFFQPIRSFATAGEGAVMYVCASCGSGQTVYTADLAVSYGEEYYSYNPESYSSLKTRIKGLIYKYASFVPLSLRHRWLTVAPSGRPGKVLDVGCGCGNSLDVWKSVGWRTFGTEITQAPVEICRAQGHDVKLSYDPWKDFADHKFEWITLDNVLEHIETPEEFLMNLRPILADQGKITICVPNYGGAPSKIFGRYWDALLPDQHVTHFTRQGLEALLARSGYKIRSLTFQPRFHLSFGNAQRYGTGDEAGRIMVEAKSWKKRAIARLATGRHPREADGYFMTADIVLAP